jgi:8-oxo-dGTP pyrophosphatase MutT (NUDIX family)
VRQPFEVLVFLHRPSVAGEEFLVLHRVDGGYWHGLSGGVEIGEDAREAATREVMEESGLDVSETLVETGLTFSYSLLHEPERLTAFETGTTDIHVTCFEARAARDWEPVLNEEHDRYLWCSLEDAAALYRWTDARAMLLSVGRQVEVRA